MEKFKIPIQLVLLPQLVQWVVLAVMVEMGELELQIQEALVQLVQPAARAALHLEEVLLVKLF